MFFELSSEGTQEGNLAGILLRGVDSGVFLT